MLTFHSLTYVLAHVYVYLLIPEAHLSSCVPRHVHPTQKHPGIVRVARRRSCRRAARYRTAQLCLDCLMVLFVDDVIHTVTVYQQVLLEQGNDIHTPAVR